MPTNADLEQAVRRLSRDRRLTIETLASDAGIHPTYLSGIERGIRNPTFGKLADLAHHRVEDALTLHLQSLLTRDRPVPGADLAIVSQLHQLSLDRSLTQVKRLGRVVAHLYGTYYMVLRSGHTVGSMRGRHRKKDPQVGKNSASPSKSSGWSLHYNSRHPRVATAQPDASTASV